MTPPPSRSPPIPKLGPRRRTNPALTYAKLRDVVDPHCGIVTDVQRMQLREPGVRGVYMYGADVEAATVLGFAPFRRSRGDHAEVWREGALGRSGSRAAYDKTRAFVRAVGEALERYACCTYDPSQFVTAPWRDVQFDALDPRRCQMPTAQEYEHPQLAGYRPFDPDAPIRWASGWSLRDERRVLVPAQLCWLMYNPIEGEPMMQQTTSTGWALHHTYEEAIHSGLREIAERDSFFVHWLNRMRPPRLDLDAVDDPPVVRFRETMRRQGIEPRVLVTTTDIGITSFAVVLADRREGYPAFVLTLGAHPDPVRGLRQAVEEAAMMHLDVTLRVRTGVVDPPQRMEDILYMSHQVEYYLLQRNLGPVEWLLEDDDAPLLRLDDLPAYAAADDDARGDIWSEVQWMVQRFADAGLEALFVDTTPPDLREAGWCAVKTLVPGSVRHEYGYGLRYLDCERIYEAPVRMGRRATPSTPDDINLDAHPYS